LYVPPSFAETDPETLRRFVAEHSFATLVSVDGDEPFASHLPLLWDREPQPHGRLVGHMARANPQWRHTDGRRVLAVFHGPHAYVSPTWYEAVNVVPTWNYAAVHLTGVLRIDEDRDRLRELVRRTVQHYEAPLPQPWFPDSPDPEFAEKLLDAIVGFTVEVDRVEGKWKLSQNHAAERRRKVVAALQATGDPRSQTVAAMMAATLPPAE
jgi:transcriptional regulator